MELVNQVSLNLNTYNRNDSDRIVIHTNMEQVDSHCNSFPAYVLHTPNKVITIH